MSDLINRQDVIKRAHLPTIEDAGYEVIRLDYILSLPTEQPEREKGEWIDGFMCSVCRKGYRSQPTIRGVPMFKYCPECGADMRGEHDE